ncbi:siderophore-interacting protein [Curtobacterium flaccumfaciens]|nr:siderophore-interacting protein [Curtobacterium flaccumfaciens]
MQRVTVTGDDLREFRYLGFDHWFRLFVQRPDQERFWMPDLDGKKWWPTFLAIPEDVRPHCANYTVAAFRTDSCEMDIDFVVHTDADGEPEGRAAIWACGTRPGDELALLDQGCIFDRPDDTTEVVIAAEETGLPGSSGSRPRSRATPSVASSRRSRPPRTSASSTLPPASP